MTEPDAASVPADAALPAGKDKERAVRTMFDRIAPRYDVLNRILTFGLDRGWRRAAVRGLQLPPSSVVLDVACGTGDFCRELAAARLVPVGLDSSWGMLVAGRRMAPLLQADALRLPVRSGAADGIGCGFALRNVVELPGLFEEFARALRPGGRVSILEVAEPASPLLRAAHGLYFRHIVPLVGGLLSDRPAYRYLPKSVAYLPSLAELLGLLADAGFASVRSTPMGLGAVRVTTGTRTQEGSEVALPADAPARLRPELPGAAGSRRTGIPYAEAGRGHRRRRGGSTGRRLRGVAILGYSRQPRLLQSGLAGVVQWQNISFPS